MKRKEKMRKRAETLKGNNYTPYSDSILNKKKRGIIETTSRRVVVKY